MTRARGVRLKQEHQIVLHALEAANAALERAASNAEVQAILSDADQRRLEKRYSGSLSQTISKILDQLATRDLVFSPGVVGRTRYYASRTVLTPEDATVPDAPSRRRKTLRLVQGAVEELGRAVLLGEVQEYATRVEAPADLTAEAIAMDVSNLTHTGDLQVIGTVRGEGSGLNLYLPAGLDPEMYRPTEPLTWLDFLAAVFSDLWGERMEAAARRDGRPRPLTTGEVRARVANTGEYPEKIEDPQLLVNALQQLARTRTPIIRKVKRRGMRAILWAPVGTKNRDLDLGSTFASDAERVGEAVRRAEERLGRPVRLEDVRDELDFDPALEPCGALPLYQVLAEAAKETIAGDAGRTARIQQHLHKVGTLRGSAYYCVARLERAEAYLRFEAAADCWAGMRTQDRFDRVGLCTLPTVAVGRAVLIRQEAETVLRDVEVVLSGGHLGARAMAVAEALREEVSGAIQSVPELLASLKADHWNVPEMVSSAVPGWTAEDLMRALEPLYPRIPELDEPRKLIPLLDKTLRRVPNPEFISRRSGHHRTASEFLFDRTDTLIRAAYRWGGHECRFQAMLADAELGWLRDHRFVTPMLDEPDHEKRLAAVACLAFLADPEVLPTLHRVAEDDPDAGVRESARWAYGFASHQGGAFDANGTRGSTAVEEAVAYWRA